MTSVTSITLFAGAAALLVSTAEAQSVSPSPPVDLKRIGEALNAPQPDKPLRLDYLPSVAIFRTSVEQRVYVPTFEDVLRKEFTLTPFQRKAREWANQCCGVNLLSVYDSLNKWSRRREERKIRQKVLQELAQVVEAAARKER